MLRVFWISQQINGWLRQNISLRVSHEWTYQLVTRDKSKGGKLHEHLRLCKKRRKRYGAPQRRGWIPNRVSINERPAVVEEHSRVGDWEVDTTIGAQHCGALVSLVERKSRLIRIAFVPHRTADNVSREVIRLLKSISDRVHPLTADTGKEFACHEDIANLLDADFYFARPYASWQRGSNENANGLIRQFFPKNRKLIDVPQSELDKVMELLNNRPRQRLGMRTPNQVFLARLRTGGSSRERIPATLRRDIPRTRPDRGCGPGDAVRRPAQGGNRAIETANFL